MKNLNAFLVGALVMTAVVACSKNDISDNTNSGGSNSSSSSGSSSSVTIDSSYTTGTAQGDVNDNAENEDDVLANSTFSDTVTINYGSSVTVTNPDESGISVSIDNNDVVVTSTSKNVIYKLEGETSNGMFKLYSDNKYAIFLDNVTLTNTDGPAINVQSKKRGFVISADNSTNTITDGSSYATAVNEEDQKGTIFSEGQLIFDGNGSLTVTGKYKHAIASDQYVRVVNGSITVSSATTDGIKAHDQFVMDGGSVTMENITNDGINVDEGSIVINDGAINIKSVGKGINASYKGTDDIDPYVTINGGTITINSTDEGIQAKSVLTINDGDIHIESGDDGLNAEDFIYINGGRNYVYSSGNDGIDSNGELTITGGKTISIGTRQPEASFDCDKRTFTITGGMIVGIAGATSGPSTSTSTIASLVMGSGSAKQIVHIESSDGKEVMTFLAPQSFQTLIYASSKLETGKKYTIYTGGTVQDGVDFNGLYMSGTYSGGSSSSSFTASSVLTQVGGSISQA